MTDTNFTDRVIDIHESINTQVYGPLESETPGCAESWETAKLIADLQLRMEELETPAGLKNSTVPRKCRQRLMRDGKPYSKSGCEACGDMSPDWRLCEALLSHESNSPSERAADSSLISWLQEEVEVSSQAAAAFTTLPSEDYYRTVVRGIARWLRKESEGHLGSGSYWAKRLEEESERL